MSIPPPKNRGLSPVSNPLLEQVMMFRPCAGGGKRKMKLRKREVSDYREETE